MASARMRTQSPRLFPRNIGVDDVERLASASTSNASGRHVTTLTMKVMLAAAMRDARTLEQGVDERRDRAALGEDHERRDEQEGHDHRGEPPPFVAPEEF